MKPVYDLKERGNGLLVIALTGDGKRETKILRAVARRFDGHNSTLLLPTGAFPIGSNRKKTGRFSGLSAFQVLRTYVEKLGYSQFIFILDIEHFGEERTTEELQTEIEHVLSGYGFGEREIMRLNDRAYRIRCKLGFHPLRINAVVSGSDRCVEENISELLRLEHNVTVAPDKRAVQAALNQLGLDLNALLANCRAPHLATAFAGLVAALQDFENQN